MGRKLPAIKPEPFSASSGPSNRASELASLFHHGHDGSVMTAMTAHTGVIPRHCNLQLHEGSGQAVSCAREATRFATGTRNDIQDATRGSRVESHLSIYDSRLTTHDFAP